MQSAEGEWKSSTRSMTRTRNIPNERSELLPRDPILWFLVGKVPERLAIPGNRQLGCISEDGQARQRVTNPVPQRFHEVPLAILTIFHPCVSFAVAAARSANESCIVTHAQQLSPGPQSKIVAVALFSFLEFFRRLPIICFAKQFLVGNIFAAGKELSNLTNRAAFDG